MPGDSGVNLGTAYADIQVNFSKFNQNLDSALSSAERSLTSRLDGIGKNLQGIGSQLTLAFAPVTGFLAAGLKEFADYDAVLTEIEARTGATAEEMELVRQTALRMGQETAFSATDASQAMLELLSSGYDLNETMLALEPTLHAAAAGNMALGESADAITDILSQFQQDASQAAHVADVLAKSSGASSATMQEMVQAFSNVGPIANSFKLSIEDTAAILATFAENGIKGAEAGTQLKSMLNNMSQQTPEVQQMWADLGVSMYDTQGNVRDLNDVIEELNVAMDGMSDQERQDAITTLAGSYGQMGLTALLAADGFDTMATKMDAASGAAEVAEGRMDSFSGVVKKVTSSIKTLALIALEPLVTKYLEPAIESVNELINKFAEFLATNPEVAEKFGILLVVLSALGPALILLGTIVSFVASSFSGLAILFGILTGPIGILIALLAAFGAAYVTNFMGFGDAVNSVVKVAVKGLGRIVDAVENVVEAFQEGGLSEAFATAKKEALSLFNDAGKGLEGFGQAFVSFVQNKLPGYLAQLAGMGSKLWGWIRESAPSLAFELGKALGQISKFIGEALVKYGPDILKALIGLNLLIYHWIITTAIPELAGFAWDLATSFINGLVEGITGEQFSVQRALGEVLIGIWSGQYFSDAAGWVWNNIIQPIVGAVTGFVGANGGLWNTAKMIGSTIFDAAASLITDVSSWVNTKIVTPIINALTSYVAANGGLWNIAKSIGSSIMDAAAAGLAAQASLNTWVWNNIIQPIITGIQSYVISNGGLWNIAKNIGSNIMDAAKAGVTALGTVATWVWNNIIQPIITGIQQYITANGGLWNIAKNIGSTLLDAAKDGITALGTVATWVWNNIIQPIITGIQAYVMANGGLWNMAKTIGSTLLNAAVQGIGDVWGWVNSNIISPITTAVSDYVAEEGGLWNAAMSIGSTLMDAAKSGIGDILVWVYENITTPLLNFLPTLAAAGGDLWNGMLSVGKGIVDGLKQGIIDNWQAFEDWVADQVGGLVNRFKDMLGIRSPSKLFASIGGELVAGLQVGVSDFSPVMNTMDALASAMQTPMDAMMGAQLQPAMAAASSGGGSSAGTTNNLYLTVTPPAEVLNNPNQQMVQENAQLWGDTFGDKFMNVIRKDG